MRQRPVRISATLGALLAGAIALGGCDTVGSPLDVIQGKRTSPDEFQVLARKPLRMPGSSDLPEPRLGAPSPLEPDARNAAIVALFGAPGAAAPGTGASPGERALLDAARVSAAAELDAELSTAEDRLIVDRPYEPPTLIELFSDSERPEGAEDAIDPAAEARRLQRLGVSAAPIDPTDRPQTETPPEAEPEILDGRFGTAPSRRRY